jgi:hypothetical protein
MTALLALLLIASDDYPTICRFPPPHGAAIRRVYELPQKIQIALGPRADLGAPFNDTHVLVKHRPQ